MRTTSPLTSNMFGGNFVKEVEPKMRGSRKDRQVELECTVCGLHFIVSLFNAKRVKQKTCSNLCAGVLRRKIEGGNMQHPLYNRWLSMRDRCNNPNNDRYSRYGARGITYAPEFDAFSVYADYCMQLPNAPIDIRETKLEIDRINNNVGYFKGNLRWANINTQAANKSQSKDATYTSTIAGVHFCKTNKRWIARVQFDNKILHQSSHLTELDAVYARQEYIVDHDLPHQLK